MTAKSAGLIRAAHNLPTLGICDPSMDFPSFLHGSVRLVAKLPEATKGNNPPSAALLCAHHQKENKMKRNILIAALIAAGATAAIPLPVGAQGVPGGVERGSREGERAA